MTIFNKIAIKTKIGVEDVNFGFGSERYNLDEGDVTVTKINSEHLPYSENNTVKDKLDTADNKFSQIDNKLEQVDVEIREINTNLQSSGSSGSSGDESERFFGSFVWYILVKPCRPCRRRSAAKCGFRSAALQHRGKSRGAVPLRQVRASTDFNWKVPEGNMIQ